MKKLALGLFLALAALGFFLSPAMAADSPLAAPALSAADRAFIASLAAQREPTPPMRAPRRPPTGGAKALCTATANCALGGTVYCEGNNSSASCSAVDGNCSWGEPGRVTCDGVTTWCPACCPSDFCTRGDACANSCAPCQADYTCNWASCRDDCQCRWSTCPP